MAKFVFNSCCGCIELRTGCLIIGYLNLIACLLLFVSTILAITAGSVALTSDDDETQELGGATLAASVVLLLVFILAFTISIVLLVGVHKNKRRHLKVYLVVSVILLVFQAVSALANIGSGSSSASRSIGSNLLSILLSIYFLMVIRSYYYKIDEEKQKPGYVARTA